MKTEQLNSIIERKVIWAEIKAMEREFKRNQEAISNLQSANKDLTDKLGEKLQRIQELAEEFDTI